MIPFDLEYYHPSSINEAVQLFHKLYQEGKEPIYYSGGTEIITLGRLHQIYTKAVIDIKGIAECSILDYQHHSLILGAALTLTQVSEANTFPLLSETASRIADRTARNKITLGGNIAGDIPYREAVLPFLLADSTCVIAGIDGIHHIPIHQLFIERLRLNRGEFLVQIITDMQYIQLPFYSVKRRKLEKIDYPLVTLTALKKDDYIRIAMSGLCTFPFRSSSMETELNYTNITVAERIEQAVRRIPTPVVEDIRGSREYRIFVLQHMLFDAITYLEEVRA